MKEIFSGEANLILESVQRRFTRLVDGIGLLPYKDRLKKLRIATLIERRTRGDIIELFKKYFVVCVLLEVVYLNFHV